MICRYFRASLVTFALLVVAAESVIAQIDMQQRVASQSAITANRSRPDLGVGVRSSGLATVPSDFSQLKLAPGFLLGLNVLDDPDFVGDFRVDEDGNIAVPVIGTLHVAGETVAETRVKIKRMLLEGKILKDPQVDLSILEYLAPEVTVIGEVGSPGKYPLFIPRKLVDVIALAGGLTILAGNEVVITGGNAGTQPDIIHYSKATNPKAVEDVLVHPGDIVQVKRAGIVYVLGAVTRPGGYVMQEEGTLNVLQAVSLANGTSITASTSTTYLIRKNEDGSVVYISVPFKKITQGKAANVTLHATDILYVPSSMLKAILTNSQSVLSAAASATIYSYHP